MVDVAITQNDRIESAIQDALDHLELDDLLRGKVVAVKPNETTATEEDQTGVTQPDTLRAMLRYVKQFEPRQLIVSGGAGAAETDEVMRVTGMMEVIQEEGAEFMDHNRPPFEEVTLPYSPEKEVASMPRQCDISGRPERWAWGKTIPRRSSTAAYRWKRR